jgi:hypothetical protein
MSRWAIVSSLLKSETVRNMSGAKMRPRLPTRFHDGG